MTPVRLDPAAPRTRVNHYCAPFAEEEKTRCFTLIVLLMSFNYQCSVSLPRGGAVGWPAMCDCGIPLSNSLLKFKCQN